MLDAITIFLIFLYTCDNYGEMKVLFGSDLLWLLWFCVQEGSHVLF